MDESALTRSTLVCTHRKLPYGQTVKEALAIVGGLFLVLSACGGGGDERGLTPVTWQYLWTIEGLVALGTLLATVTAFLAWRTSRMANKTADLAAATESVATGLVT
jgi:hypothetical protein